MWVLGVVLVASGCATSQSVAEKAAPAAGAGRSATSGPLPGYQHSPSDLLTPLIITSLAPDPIPVRGSDDRFHVAYELSIFNDSPRPATITRLETLAGDETGPVIFRLSHNQVVALSLLTADYPSSPTPVSEIPAGRTVLVALDDVYPTARAVPARVTHRITATFGPVPPGQTAIATAYPAYVVQIGGSVTTSTLRPVVIGPPVTGDGWVANNGLAQPTLNIHRGALVPVGGRINGAERYAVDWIRVDLSLKPPSDVTGDPSKNESYFAFDQPLVAVADATVTTVVSDKPDIPPGAPPEAISFDQVIGNNVVLDLGHGVFAVYAHMKHDSATVTVGQKVKKGQIIGRVGNSGNTSVPHVHFHLMRGPLALTYDNVPWEIDHFILLGDATEGGVVSVPTTGARTNELPLGSTVSNFPTTGH